MLDSVALPRNPGGEDVGVVATAHGGECVGTVDPGLLEGLTIEADALDRDSREAAAQATEGLGILVDDGDRVACLVEAIGQE